MVATIYDNEKNLSATLKAGAQGYILKDQDKDKIISHPLPLHIAVETVRGYVKSLYSKLGINNRAELTLIAVRLGLAS